MKCHDVPVGPAVHGSCPRAGPAAGPRSYGCRCACAPPGPERVVREGATAPRDKCAGPEGKCGMAAGQGHGSGGQGAKQLRNAVAKGSAERVAELLRQGTDPGARDRRGRTPLHIAVRRSGGSGRVIRALAGAGPDHGCDGPEGELGPPPCRTPSEPHRLHGPGGMRRGTPCCRTRRG